MTTVYPTSTHGAHGNSGHKTAGKDVFSSGKGRKCLKMSGNRYSGFLWDSVEKATIISPRFFLSLTKHGIPKVPSQHLVFVIHWHPLLARHPILPQFNCNRSITTSQQPDAITVVPDTVLPDTQHLSFLTLLTKFGGIGILLIGTFILFGGVANV